MKTFVIRLFDRFTGLLYMLVSLFTLKYCFNHGLSPNTFLMIILTCIILIGFTVFVAGMSLDKIIYKIKDYYKTQKIKRNGKKINDEVKKLLQYLNEDRYKIFNDINLKINGLEHQFNHIVIGSNSIFNISSIDFSNSIIIDSSKNAGCIYRFKSYRKIIEKIVEHKFPVVDIAVVEGDKLTLEENCNELVNFVKEGHLLNFIRTYPNDENIDINKIKNKLITYKTRSEVKDPFIEQFYNFDINKENFLFYILAIILLATTIRSMM